MFNEEGCEGVGGGDADGEDLTEGEHEPEVAGSEVCEFGFPRLCILGAVGFGEIGGRVVGVDDFGCAMNSGVGDGEGWLFGVAIVVFARTGAGAGAKVDGSGVDGGDFGGFFRG